MFENNNNRSDESEELSDDFHISPVTAFGLALGAAELIADDRPEVDVRDMDLLSDIEDERSAEELISLKERKVYKRNIPAFELMVMKRCGLK